MMHDIDNKTIITCPELLVDGSAQHAFLTRNFPGTTHRYINKNDSIANEEIISNKSAGSSIFGLPSERIVFLNQVHSNKVIVVSEPWEAGFEPKADAMVTKEKNIILAIMTADCVPILFSSADGEIIAAAHSGWRGARYGIIENTVHTMSEHGANIAKISATIGPCIRQESYEVSEEFLQEFLSESRMNSQFFLKSVRKHHYMFDLVSYVKNKLAQLGVNNIYDVKRDTCKESSYFFSYRRSVLHNDPSQMGSLLSLIIRK